jgi:predicted lipid-binding transport protein (Tim44 family)
MVAAFILLRLRSELGKKTGNEPLPPAAGRQHGGAPGDEDARDRRDTTGRPSSGDVIDLEENPQLRQAYQDIRRADRSFDVSQFLTGARAAHQMILEAFWAGDKETLKEFLDDSVLQQFSAAVDQREADGLTLHNKLIDVTEVDIIDAQLVDRTAEITVHVRAEIIAVTKDRDGKVVDGNTSDAVEVNDKWTFARDTRSRDPNWMLVATQPG